MTTTAKLAALIPTRESDIYPTLGIDIIEPAEYDEDGDCLRDMEPIQWIELGSFEDEHDIDAAAEAAGCRILWHTREAVTADYDEVEVEAIR